MCVCFAQVLAVELEEVSVGSEPTELYGRRKSIDGYVCEYTWRTRSRGITYTCHTYCCRLSYNTYASYCRVWEYGRQVLKQCRAYTSLSEEEEDVAVSEDGSAETFTWTSVGAAGACIAVLGVVLGWSIRKRGSIREQPLLA